MTKQFTIITKDGSKWLRPVNPFDNNDPRFTSKEPFCMLGMRPCSKTVCECDEWKKFEKNNLILPYIGSHPEGTAVYESEVREVRQLMICGAWVEYEESMDMLSSQERKAYVDVRNKIRLGANRGYVLVDEDDYNTLSQYKWHLSTDGTARNKDVGMMHRFITNAPKGMVVDHINHNRLDNRKINLRVCTHSENMRNQLRRTDGSSKYKGVSWDKKGDRWRACIEVDGRQLYLGLFTSEIEAARAYDEAAIRRFGDFSLTNFPVSNYSYIYTDAESHDRHISDDYWRKRCESAEKLIGISPSDPKIYDEFCRLREEWDKIVKQEPK